MREQRSGLWFLRSSRELDEKGLSLILDGFQSQVFLDIFEVADDNRRLYSAVYEALGGRGIPDLADAVQDIVLRDLYEALARLASPDFFASLRELSSAGERGSAKAQKAFIEGARAEALGFYEIAYGLIRETAAEEGMPGGAEIADAAEKAAARLAAGLKALFEIPALLAEDKEAAAFIGQRLEEPGAVELLGAYLILDGLKGLVGKAAAGEEARRLSERLCLSRKLREALRAPGIQGDLAYRGLALAEAALEKGEAAKKAADKARKAKESEALAILRLLLSSDEEIRGLIGVNVFEGVEWFNKELFEETCDFGLLDAALLLETTKKDATRKERREALLRATAFAQELGSAEAASGFRLEALLEALEGGAK
jgi:hypothetical protein